MYMAARQLLIQRIVAAGTSFSPLPCQAWHGYMVTSAHIVEVEVGTDGPASAPPSGAAAAAPLVGASMKQVHQNRSLEAELACVCPSAPHQLVQYKPRHCCQIEPQSEAGNRGANKKPLVGTSSSSYKQCSSVSLEQHCERLTLTQQIQVTTVFVTA
jgi:hypothetical protein